MRMWLLAPAIRFVLRVRLAARLKDGTTVRGETKIGKVGSHIERLYLEPEDCHPLPEALAAIYDADVVTIGPGSLYTSLLPPILVHGVAEAIAESSAVKIFICNLMTQPGETDGMDCLDHVRAIIDHVGPVLDAVLINAMPPSDEAIRRYARKGAYVVPSNRRDIISAGVVPVEADLLKEGSRIRHDSRKVARCLLKMARSGL